MSGCSVVSGKVFSAASLKNDSVFPISCPYQLPQPGEMEHPYRQISGTRSRFFENEHTIREWERFLEINTPISLFEKNSFHFTCIKPGFAAS
jgi:hypothetical protein